MWRSTNSPKSVNNRSAVQLGFWLLGQNWWLDGDVLMGRQRKTERCTSHTFWVQVLDGGLVRPKGGCWHWFFFCIMMMGIFIIMWGSGSHSISTFLSFFVTTNAFSPWWEFSIIKCLGPLWLCYDIFRSCPTSLEHLTIGSKYLYINFVSSPHSRGICFWVSRIAEVLDISPARNCWTTLRQYRSST